MSGMAALVKAFRRRFGLTITKLSTVKGTEDLFIDRATDKGLQGLLRETFAVLEDAEVQIKIGFIQRDDFEHSQRADVVLDRSVARKLFTVQYCLAAEGVMRDTFYKYSFPSKFNGLIWPDTAIVIETLGVLKT